MNSRTISRTLTKSSHFCLAMVMSFATVGTLTAHAAGQPFQKKLDAAVQDFNRKKLAADRYVVREYGRYRRLLKSDQSISEATRSEMLSRLDKYVRDFKSDGTFPSIVETVELEIGYQERLNKGFVRISRLLENELRDANHAGNSKYAAKLLKTKRDLETSLLSFRPINDGSVFHGTLTRPNGATIPFKLNISAISDSGDFEGVVDDNPGVAGHWRYKVAGSQTGSMVQFEMTQSLRGKLVSVQGRGIVTSNGLLAILKQKTVRNQASQNIVLLQR